MLLFKKIQYRVQCVMTKSKRGANACAGHAVHTAPARHTRAASRMAPALTAVVAVLMTSTLLLVPGPCSAARQGAHELASHYLLLVSMLVSQAKSLLYLRRLAEATTLTGRTKICPHRCQTWNLTAASGQTYRIMVLFIDGQLRCACWCQQQAHISKLIGCMRVGS